MKKNYAIIISAFLLATAPTLSFAAGTQYTQTNGAGNKIQCPANTTAKTPLFSFQASPKIVMSAAGTPTSFSVSAYHESALAATKGEAYGMASNVAGFFTLDISASNATSATVPAMANGNSSDFGSTWKQPDGTAATGS